MKLGIEQIGAQGAGGGFLANLNTTMQNFKGLVELAGKLKESGVNADQTAAIGPGGGGGFQEFINTLIAEGHGDKPLGALFQEVAPYSLKQIMALLEGVKNARPKE